MKQTRADTWTAVWQALLLHAVLLVLMFAGLQWSRSEVPEAAQGSPVDAQLIDIGDLSAPMRRALQRSPEAPEPPPAPEPEPLPEPVVEEPSPKELPPPVPDPAPVEQEKVQRDADSPQVANVQREQDEKRKPPEQAELDAPKPTLSERDRLLQEIRKQRELAARERSMAEQRAQQLADARNAGATPTRPPPGDPDSLSSKRASYAVALMNAILRQWTRPESVALGQICQVTIRQLPGGEVVSVEISSSCPYDALGRRSVEAAILKASPLPYAGFEDVFVRDPTLKFRAEDL